MGWLIFDQIHKHLDDLKPEILLHRRTCEDCFPKCPAGALAPYGNLTWGDTAWTITHLDRHTGVGMVCISNMDCFGLTPLRDQTRRCCPGSGVSASAQTAPGSLGVARCTNSGARLEPPQIARRRRSASGYKRQIATSGPPSVSRWHISVACRRRPTIGWPPSAHHRLATGGPPSAGHCWKI